MCTFQRPLSSFCAPPASSATPAASSVSHISCAAGPLFFALKIRQFSGWRLPFELGWNTVPSPPNLPSHSSRALTSTDQQVLCWTNPSNDGFWGSEIGKKSWSGLLKLLRRKWLVMEALDSIVSRLAEFGWTSISAGPFAPQSVSSSSSSGMKV